MQQNPFADLIPNGGDDNPFADLIPAAEPQQPQRKSGPYGTMPQGEVAARPQDLTYDRFKQTFRDADKYATDLVKVGVDSVPVVGGLIHNLAGLEEKYFNSGDFDAGFKNSKLDAERAVEDVGDIPALGAALGANVLAFRGGMGGLQALRMPGVAASIAGQGWAPMVGGGMGVGGLDAWLRGEDVEKGAVIGGLAGVGGKAAGAVYDKATGALSRYMDPEGSAKRWLASTTDRGDAVATQDTRQKLYDDLTSAADDGDNEFMLMDAVGDRGVRTANAIRRTGGEGSEQIASTLNNRIMGQSERLQRNFEEGFEATDTAEQATKELKSWRGQTGDTNYRAAEAAAGDVEPTNTADALAKFPGLNAKRAFGIELTPAEKSVEAMRNKLMSKDGNAHVADFQSMVAIKSDLFAEIKQLERQGNNAKARALRKVHDAMDKDLEAASPLYRQANDKYREQSGVVDAVDSGAQSYKGSRHEDAVNKYMKLTPDERVAFRLGFGDRAIKETQGPGFDKINRFLAPGTRAKMDAFAAPGQADKLSRRMDREKTMSVNNNRVMSGSATADNLADIRDLEGIDMGGAVQTGANILTGNKAGLAAQALGAITNSVKRISMPAGFRNELTRVLMAKDPRAVEQLINDANMSVAKKLEIRKAIEGAGMLTGYVGGELAVQ